MHHYTNLCQQGLKLHYAFSGVWVSLLFLSRQDFVRCGFNQFYLMFLLSICPESNLSEIFLQIAEVHSMLQTLWE